MNYRCFLVIILIGGIAGATTRPGYSAGWTEAVDVTDAELVNSGSNIFSKPIPQDETPSFAKPRDIGARLQALDGGGERIPTFQQVRQIPSLTAQQRLSIRQVYDRTREQMQPLMEELKSLRTSTASADGAPAGNPDAAGKFRRLRELKQQMIEQRQSAWSQVKSLLTEKQLEDLERMRRGELLPASLKNNEGAERMRSGVAPPPNLNKDARPGIGSSGSPDEMMSGEIR